MEEWGLVAVAAVVLAYAAVSGRLAGTPLTAAMVFVAGGLLIGEALGLLEIERSTAAVELLAEATLAVVLFSDGFRIDLRALRHERTVPVRLLGVGLPLTIALGALAGGPLLGIGLLEGLILAIVLAPTDAALGQAVVSDPRLPSRIRQGLNVESGLNDGICVPLLFIAIALTEAEEGATGWTDALVLVLEAIGYGLVGGIVGAVLVAVVLGVLAPRGIVALGSEQVAPLMGAVIAYGTADALGGSGFIAAFAGGMLAGGLTRVALERGRETGGDDASHHALELTEGVGSVLNGVTFVVFGAAILGPSLGGFGGREVLYAVLSLTAFRMLPVAVAMLGTGARRPTVALLGWFGPRGLASIVFGVIVLDEARLLALETVLDTVTLTVALSVLVHGLTAAPLTTRYARWLTATARATPMELHPAPEVPARRPLGLHRR